MAYAGRLDLDQHLALSGTIEIDSFDLERNAGLMCDSGFNLHQNASFDQYCLEGAAGGPASFAISELLADQDHSVANRAAAVGVEHVEGYRVAAVCGRARIDSHGDHRRHQHHRGE